MIKSWKVSSQRLIERKIQSYYGKNKIPLEKLRGNLQFVYYPSGHMIYLNPEALDHLKTDLSTFYDHAAPQR